MKTDFTIKYLTKNSKGFSVDDLVQRYYIKRTTGKITEFSNLVLSLDIVKDNKYQAQLIELVQSGKVQSQIVLWTISTYTIAEIKEKLKRKLKTYLHRGDGLTEFNSLDLDGGFVAPEILLEKATEFQKLLQNAPRKYRIKSDFLEADAESKEVERFISNTRFRTTLSILNYISGPHDKPETIVTLTYDLETNTFSYTYIIPWIYYPDEVYNASTLRELKKLLETKPDYKEETENRQSLLKKAKEFQSLIKVLKKEYRILEHPASEEEEKKKIEYFVSLFDKDDGRVCSILTYVRGPSSNLEAGIDLTYYKEKNTFVYTHTVYLLFWPDIKNEFSDIQGLKTFLRRKGELLEGNS